MPKVKCNSDKFLMRFRYAYHEQYESFVFYCIDDYSHTYFLSRGDFGYYVGINNFYIVRKLCLTNGSPKHD